MFQEKTEEIEFVSSKEREDFIKKVDEALENHKLTSEDYMELKELFE